MNQINLELFLLINYCWIAIVIAVHVTMFYIKAPFGRHTSEKWGLSINNKLGWFLLWNPFLANHDVFSGFGSNSLNSMFGYCFYF